MATSNERIFDGLTRRQIGLLRLAAGIGRDMQTILRDSDPALREFLTKRLAALGDPSRRQRAPATLQRLKTIEKAWIEKSHPAFLEARKLLRERLAETALSEAEFTKRLLQRTLPVIVDPSIPDAQTLRSISSRALSQGRPLREILSDWELADRKRVFAQIRVGVLAGETPSQVARRIVGTEVSGGANGIRAVSRRYAELISRTTMSAITNRTRENVYELNDDIIQWVIYRATLDSRTSPICRALDGRKYKPGSGPRPPQHPNCRSNTVPVIDGAPLGTRPAVPLLKSELDGLSREARRKRVRELVGPVPAKTTYSQFLRRQSAAFQDEVLGRSRGRLFRSGRLDLADFVDLRSGRQLSLNELNQKYDLD